MMLALESFFGLSFRVVTIVAHVFSHLVLIRMRAYPLGLSLGILVVLVIEVWSQVRDHLVLVIFLEKT